MWYEIYPLQNLNVPTIEVPEWISNFTQHFIMDSWWRHIHCPDPMRKNIADTKQWRHRLKSMVSEILETMQ